MKKSQKGFTLVELIVVIAIIGVLAAILVPAMVGYIKDSKFTSANANAKTIYNAAMAFSQKCETAGRAISKTDNTTTGALTVGAAGSAPKVSKVGATSDTDDTYKAPAANKLANNAVAEIKKAVNNSLGEEAEGSAYGIVYDAKGFPTDVFWGKTADDVIVGSYPASDDNLESSGGVSGICGSESDAKLDRTKFADEE